MADEGYPSREDRIVAEFGDGYEVEGIAWRYSLTVEQVYAVIERAVGPAPQSRFAPPPVGYPGQVHGVRDDDAIVAEYGEGHDVEAIARKHGIDVDLVYEIVLDAVDTDDDPPRAG